MEYRFSFEKIRIKFEQEKIVLCILSGVLEENGNETYIDRFLPAARWIGF